MSKEVEEIKRLKGKISQYKTAMNTQPLLSVEWIKNNILNQNKDD